MKNVRDFGAVGDGMIKDTAAIQRALAGGGTVLVPGGRYLIGSLYLSSNTTLLLDDDAVLVGSPDIEDYNAVDFCPQNRDCPAEKASGRHLIIAVEAHHIVVKGGKIDGNQAAFFDPGACSRDDFTGWRPSQMLYFWNVLISGSLIRNYGMRPIGPVICTGATMCLLTGSGCWKRTEESGTAMGSISTAAGM